MSADPGSFSYENDDVNTIQVNANITAKIERINAHIARIYVVNNLNVQVPFPVNITVTDAAGLRVAPYQDNVLITWVDSYTMMEGGVEVFRLRNQKQQSVRAAPGTVCGVETA